MKCYLTAAALAAFAAHPAQAGDIIEEWANVIKF